MLYHQVELEVNQAGRAWGAGIQFILINYFGFQYCRSGSGWPGA